VRIPIARHWDGEPAAPSECAELALSRTEDTLIVRVDAPFHDDPAPPGSPGPTDLLWDYEVVELFLLAQPDHYLEIELGPHGHHLVLELRGRRQPVRRGRELGELRFDTEIDMQLGAQIGNQIRNQIGRRIGAQIDAPRDAAIGAGIGTPSDQEIDTQSDAGIDAKSDPARWRATARIPLGWLPRGTSHANAYALHGCGAARRHLAWQPVPGPLPDFHRLDCFAPLDPWADLPTELPKSSRSSFTRSHKPLKK
jgi:hypothetical protein